MGVSSCRFHAVHALRDWWSGSGMELVSWGRWTEDWHVTVERGARLLR